MSAQVYRAGDLQPAPWKNGGGTTRQVASAPPAAGTSDFDWRISIADVTASGPFSTFPGVERVIVLMGGAGMVLEVDGRIHELTLFEPFVFSGDADTTCDVAAGPTRDLNVMTRRATVRAEVEVRAVVGSETVDATDADEVVLVVLSGRVSVSGPDLQTALAPLDCAVWSAPACFELDGHGKAAVVELHACAPPGSIARNPA